MSSSPLSSVASSSATPAAASVPAPKILLAKPPSSRPDAPAAVPSSLSSSAASGPLPTVVKLMRGGDRDREDESNAGRGRLTHGSLNLISESWEFCPERLLPLMSENTDFAVVGVLGPPGVGKSTILNELYGFDSSSAGASPPFSVQTDETKAMARHCSVGVELRMAAERIILLDTQPLFSASVLTDLMRPDGSSSVSVLVGETLSAELAHEMMGIQLGVFLASVCHVLLLVSEGLHDISLWRLMLTVEMLKQGIPDPSFVNTTTSGSHLQQSADKDEADLSQEEAAEFFAETVFIHTKLREHECSWYNVNRLKKALSAYFTSPSFRKNRLVQYMLPQQQKQSESVPVDVVNNNTGPNFFILPLRVSDDALKMQHESYTSMIRQLRDQVLSMPHRSFARSITERDWLRNSARIWDLVKKSPVLVDYSQLLQNSGLYRR